MENKPMGTVISTERTPSSMEFCFIVDSTARKGQFVTIDTEEGKMVARIADIVRTNRYFERAESVQEFERSGKPLTEMFPADRWEYLVARANSLGVYKDGKLMKSAFPASPGTKVFIAEKELLSDFFGMDLEKGMDLGKIEYHDVPVKLNMTRLMQKHLAILGISGSGKSYSVGAVLEELLDRKEEDGQMAVVVIDTHGEYTGFMEDPNYKMKTDVIKGKDFKIGVPGITGSMIAEFLTSITSVQRRELNKMLSLMSEENRGKTYDLKDILNRLESSDIKSTTRDILYTLILDLDNTRLFAGYDNPSLEKLAKSGHLTIIDVSDMVGMREKQIVATYLARKLFNARRAGAIPPFGLVIEEAHQFAPETAKRERAISRGIITTIAREGRKFHASLCLISQRPIQLSTTALSQCNTHLIMRVSNPYDLDHLGKSSEGLTKDSLAAISSLRVGEGVIVGEAVNFPLFFKVRERKSKVTDKGVSLEKACLEFTGNKKQRDEDIRGFM